MRQHLERQSLTSRGSFENSHSKKTKSIRSIRIVDHQKENNPQSKPLNSGRDKSQTARDPSPHEFSFKKQYPAIHQPCEQWLLKDKITSQQEQLKKLDRMLKSMSTKLSHQQQQYDTVKPQYEEYTNSLIANVEFKRQICELKDLMKELLMEKQNDRMMVFYQDS